jgi:hypothetical protein
MSHHQKRETCEALDAVLMDVLRLKQEEAWRVTEALHAYAQAIADDEIDRLFNRGDYRG